MSTRLLFLITAYRSSGRVVTVFPRLKMISLNGGKRRSFQDAQDTLEQVFKFKQAKGLTAINGGKQPLRFPDLDRSESFNMADVPF